MKLEIELIPEKSWGRSLANILPQPVWDTLRREVYAEFGYSCAICSTDDKELHCHEVWEYKGKIQFLKGFQCLCRDCHNIKHWGRTIYLLHDGKFTQDYIDSLRKHFCEVNQCTEMDMIRHIVEAGDKNLKRSRYRYTIDFGKFTPERVIEAWRKKH